MIQKRNNRVLVVDDDQSIRRVYQRILSDAGYDVETVADALGGLEAARAWKPDLVLLDISLPNVTGDELAPVLKVDPATRDALIVAFSGYLIGDESVQLRARGFDAILSKARPAQEIVDFLGELLAQRG